MLQQKKSDMRLAEEEKAAEESKKADEEAAEIAA